MSDLRWLFIDLDAYFASAEQQDHPELRGAPVAVAHTLVPAGTLIAVSYEARRYDVRTGMRVAEAQASCPSLRIMPSREARYVDYHRAIVQAVEEVLPGGEVRSIDELICPLPSDTRETAQVRELAQRVKRAIARGVGESFRCPIGVAPNPYVAKIASDMEKPDGLTIIHSAELPDRLHVLNVRDFPGIGPAMEQRFARHGILTGRALCVLSMKELRHIWGGIGGEYLYRRIRGEDTPEPRKKRYSIGHSHVLTPDERGRDAALRVANHLTVRAAARLRAEKMWTRGVWLHVRFGDRLWEAHARCAETQATPALLAILHELWDEFPTGQPGWVSVAFHPLIPDAFYTPSFFEDARPQKVSELMDQMNARYGAESVFPASLADRRNRTSPRISFTRIPAPDEWTR